MIIIHMFSGHSTFLIYKRFINAVYAGSKGGIGESDAKDQQRNSRT